MDRQLAAHGSRLKVQTPASGDSGATFVASACRAPSVAAQPAFVVGGVQKSMRVTRDRFGVAGEGGIEVSDDLIRRARTVAALENFSRSGIQFDQAFRVEQDVRLLTGFVAEDIVRTKPRASLGDVCHGGGHGAARQQAAP